MHGLLIAVSSLIFAAVGACAQENDVAAAIDNVVGKLDDAFEMQDAEAVKALMTADRVAVTPYYGTPRSVDKVIRSLPDLKYEQTDLSEPKVILLGPNAGMRSLTAKAERSFKGKPFSDRVLITSIMMKQDGRWLGKFYQETHLAP